MGCSPFKIEPKVDGLGTLALHLKIILTSVYGSVFAERRSESAPLPQSTL